MLFSYITIEEMEVFIHRNYLAKEKWIALTSEQKQDILNTASYSLDKQFVWAGQKYSETQTLEFPRLFYENCKFNGLIPTAIKTSIIDIVIFMLNSENFELLFVAKSMNLKNVSDSGQTQQQFDITFMNSISESVIKWCIPFTFLGNSMNTLE